MTRSSGSPEILLKDETLTMPDLPPLDFELAYERVVDELDDQFRSGRAFVANVFEREMVNVDLPRWLEELAHDVASGSFTPGPMAICPAPKGGNLVRPGARMSLRDRVVYTAVVGEIVPTFVKVAGWSQRKVDFAPLFHATHPTKRNWLVRPYLGWNLWTEGSAAHARKASVKWVVVADIAGFYENVGLTRLGHELRRMGVDESLVGFLHECTSSWAVAEDRGLPQGVLASDILAKLYMEGVDHRLHDEGLEHFRYADDVRIFCRSFQQAQRALLLLTEALRERGLTIQSAKTKICPADEDTARAFEGALPIIKDLNRKFISEAIDAGALSPEMASVPVSVIDDLVEDKPDALDPEVSRRAWRKYVIGASEPNRSIFRYVLRRFAAVGDTTGVEYCARCLSESPETATEVLRYFEALPRSRVEGRVTHALTSRGLALFPFTRYQILDWYRRTGAPLRAAALKAVRAHAFAPEQPDYLRALAAAILARNGSHADLDRIAARVTGETDAFHRAQLLCCLPQLEPKRRAALVSHFSRDGDWGARAAALADAGPPDPSITPQ